jgi:protoporphyrin/coproporphyrin ferrochelatase
LSTKEKEKMKLAIVLFNLGGPDQVTSIEPFLFNLFNDKAIISAPQPIRWLLAKYISLRRAPVAAEIYAYLGGKSPILDLTRLQAEALNKSVSTELGSNVEVQTFISMRYWHPMSDECAKNVKDFNPDHIVLLPLYPQFSTTTTESSFKSWHKSAKKIGLKVKTSSICCYPQNEGLIEAIVENLWPQIEETCFLDKPRVLFSAHGLPKKIIDGGDPYQWQVEQTALAVVKKLNLPALDWWVSYQSKVGPMEWIGPSTEDEIERAGREKIPLIIVPIAFVSEHSETLVELDIEYKEHAQKCGVPSYMRTPVVGTHPSFINGLRDLVLDHIGENMDIKCDGKQRICPQKLSRCICKE